MTSQDADSEYKIEEVDSKRYDMPLQTPTQVMKKNPAYTPSHVSSKASGLLNSTDTSNRPS